MKNDLRDLIYKHEVHADLRARSLWETWSHDPVARSVLSTLLPRLRHPEGRLWSTARPFIPNPRIVYYLSLLTRCMVMFRFLPRPLHQLIFYLERRTTRRSHTYFR